MQAKENKEVVLFVGDPHLKVSRIEDAKEFLDKLFDTIAKEQPDRVVILGDMFDTFAVIRSEILSLWSNFLYRLSKHLGFHQNRIVLLVGNHDYAGAKGGSHSLEPFREVAKVVDDLDLITIGGAEVVVVPFIRDNQNFEGTMNELGDKSRVLICHQSFNGARFENGFYDPHGADPLSVRKFAKVISGHIHTKQSVGDTIYYPGTPFQQSFGEAGHQKSLTLAEIGVDVPGVFSIIKEIDLDMPKFYVLTNNDEIQEAMANPDPRGSYKFVGSGPIQSITSFWRSEEAKAFRGAVRRVVDAMVAQRDESDTVIEKVSSMEDKLEAFIKSRKWRTPQEELIGRARRFLSS